LSFVDIFSKNTQNIKFQENPSRVVPCGRTEGHTDKHDEANICSSQFSARALKKHRPSISMYRFKVHESKIIPFSKSQHEQVDKIASVPCEQFQLFKTRLYSCCRRLRVMQRERKKRSTLKIKVPRYVIKIGRILWPSHPKLLVQQIVNYTLADLTNMYRKYNHKRTKHILL